MKISQILLIFLKFVFLNYSISYQGFRPYPYYVMWFYSPTPPAGTTYPNIIRFKGFLTSVDAIAFHDTQIDATTSKGNKKVVEMSTGKLIRPTSVPNSRNILPSFFNEENKYGPEYYVLFQKKISDLVITPTDLTEGEVLAQIIQFTVGQEISNCSVDSKGLEKVCVYGNYADYSTSTLDDNLSLRIFVE